MVDRINLILKAKNITARQFAEEIGIQPSGMSHILGGRNNPSLEFVTKVIRRYPEIDANWLLLGRGAMVVESTTTPSVADPSPALPPDVDRTPVAPVDTEPSLFSNIEEPEPVSVPEVKPYDDTPAASETLKAGEPSTYVPTYMAVPPEPQPAEPTPEP